MNKKIVPPISYYVKFTKTNLGSLIVSFFIVTLIFFVILDTIINYSLTQFILISFSSGIFTIMIFTSTRLKDNKKNEACFRRFNMINGNRTKSILSWFSFLYVYFYIIFLKINVFMII